MAHDAQAHSIFSFTLVNLRWSAPSTDMQHNQTCTWFVRRQVKEIQDYNRTCVLLSMCTNTVGCALVYIMCRLPVSVFRPCTLRSIFTLLRLLSLRLRVSLPSVDPATSLPARPSLLSCFLFLFFVSLFTLSLAVWHTWGFISPLHPIYHSPSLPPSLSGSFLSPSLSPCCLHVLLGHSRRVTSCTGVPRWKS